MGLKGLYESKLVALYIFNKPAEGDLKRPFKQAPGLFGGEFHSAGSTLATFTLTLSLLFPVL